MSVSLMSEDTRDDLCVMWRALHTTVRQQLIVASSMVWSHLETYHDETYGEVMSSSWCMSPFCIMHDYCIKVVSEPVVEGSIVLSGAKPRGCILDLNP